MVKVGMTVIQLVPGKTVETIERDEDYRTGRISAIVVKRVKVTWADNDYVYVDSDLFDKADKDTLIYTNPLETDI